MKVLVTGRAIPQQPDRCTGQQLAEGFRQAGHECVFYGCFYGQPQSFLGVKEVQGQNFDLVIVTEMNDGMPGYQTLFNYYKLKDVPRLYWDFDVSYHPHVSIPRATAYKPDGYLVGNRFFLDDTGFGKLGKPVLHLPYACSPQIHRRKLEIPKQTLVGFVGSITPERQALLDNVRCISGVFGEALIDSTNELYTMVHVNQNACKGLVPGRPWETAGCGTNLLMDRASYEDFVEFLNLELLDAGCVMAFDSPSDIQTYIRNAQDNPSALEASGKILMNYIHSKHSYKNRAAAILKWTKEQEILQ